MVAAGLMPAAMVYALRLLRDELYVEPATGASYHLLAASLTVIASVVFATLFSRRIGRVIDTALDLSRRDREKASIGEDRAGFLADITDPLEPILDVAEARKLELDTLRECVEELEMARAQLHAAWECTGDAILVVRHETGDVISANGNFRTLFGLEEESLRDLGYSLLKSCIAGRFVDAERFEETWSALASLESECVDEEWDLSGTDAGALRVTSRPVTSRDGAVRARLWLFHDLTSERRLRQSLEQAQRLESVGRLAGGVAHDFNNILTGIIGNLALAEDGCGDESGAEDPNQKLIVSAKRAGERAAQLVRQLLGYSRKADVHVERLDVNLLLRDVESLIRHTLEPGVRFETDLKEGVWPIRGDWTQIEQVVLNMCVNARDALQDGEGEIELGSANVTITEEDAAKDDELEAGEFVKISIRDTGEGMSANVINRIFDPFFTTKDAGKGTGLGLAISGEIIRQYGGWLICESTKGEGTLFEIYLPRDEEETEVLVEGDSRVRSGSTGGNETILLVDDEELVRAVAERMLVRRGYTILSASDGDEAVEIFDRERENIDLVMLDLTMPKVSGKAAFRMLRERQSDLPVILCSGYVVDTEAFAKETGLHADGALQKPFNPEELLGEVRRVLDDFSGVILTAE